MPSRHIDPAILIGAFISAILVIAFAVAHLIERAGRIFIDRSD